MRQVLVGLIVGWFCLLGSAFIVEAKEVEEVVGVEATMSAEASISALLVPKEDLTQPKEAKSRLERVLESKEVDELKWNNFLQVAIRKAVENGVPVNMLVLMMLFPLVAAIIAGARHIVGLQGYGIFTPAVISIAFLATGVTVGVLLFVGILLVATLARMVTKRLRLPSLPRMALLLWFVSLGILGLMLVSPWLKLSSLIELSIFPVLLLILLAETFIEVQVTTTLNNALTQTAQTFILALISFLVMSTETLQAFVLLNPEVSVLGIALLDILIGRYDGLRLMEKWRFRQLLKD